MTQKNSVFSIDEAPTGRDFTLQGERCDAKFEKRSDTLLVSFDNLAAKRALATPSPFETLLARKSKDLEYSRLSFQSHFKDWYRHLEPVAWLATLSEQGFFKGFQDILFVGLGMGGFAALNFAPLVNQAKVLAFSPQSTLNRKIAPFERRFPYAFKKVDWNHAEYLDAAAQISVIPAGLIIYDPQVSEDRQHALRLRTPSLIDFAIPFSGRQPFQLLTETGALDHLLATFPAKGAIDSEFLRLLKNKRKVEDWVEPFLDTARQKRGANCFEKCCNALASAYGSRYAKWCLTEIPKKRKSSAILDWTASETEIRRVVPVFVNSYNQFTYLRDTLDWLSENGFRNVTVLDNLSNYDPLLEYYESDDFKQKARLKPLGENLGPRLALDLAAQDKITDQGFIFTDPDLLLPPKPAPDMLKAMYKAGKVHGFTKVGLALSVDPDINDLNLVTYRTRTVGQVEVKYWRDEVDDQCYQATTDTTFFLYVPQPNGPKRFVDLGLRQAKIPAIRIGAPGFVATHRPWMRKDVVDAVETEHYHRSVSRHSTFVLAQRNQKTQTSSGVKNKMPTWQETRQLLQHIVQALSNDLDHQVSVVQVGANDGKMADPIFPFIARGDWRGVLVEPHPIYFAELKQRHKDRPGLKLYNLAISTEAGEFKLYHLSEAARARYPRGIRGCASLDKSRMEHALKRGSRRKGNNIQEGDLTSTVIQARRLDELLQEAQQTRADLLVVDVEGHELPVLKSFDISTLGLKMAIVECNGQNSNEENEIAQELRKAQLEVFRIGEDLIGVHAELKSPEISATLKQLQLVDT